MFGLINKIRVTIASECHVCPVAGEHILLLASCWSMAFLKQAGVRCAIPRIDTFSTFRIISY